MRPYCNSDILVKFAEGGTMEATENILVDNAIMHCKVFAGGKVEVKGKKGQIVGGNILARDEIYAKNIGTPLGTKTYLTVGIDKFTKEKLGSELIGKRQSSRYLKVR
jgi:uncharacterized protein (DUF342 family)